MSILRVGLSETKDFADGYDAIFGKKDKPPAPTTEAKKEVSTTEEPKGNPENPFRKGEGIGC